MNLKTYDWKAQEAKGIVKACPRCGTMALANCWHPDIDSVATVEMSAEKALELRLVSLHQLLERMRSVQIDVDNLNKIIKEKK